MIEVPLEKLPNQQLLITLDDINFKISVKWIDEQLTIIDIFGNGQAIVRGLRLVPEAKLFYTFQESKWGNFMFTSDADEEPDYQKFGLSQSLVYLEREREVRP